MDGSSEIENARRSWLGALANAPQGRIAALLDLSGLRQPIEWLRAPEIGSVMIRGRMGANGAAFNLGEMTVTRCSLRLGDGTVGHGYVQGRDKAAAECAALVDALMQTDIAATVSAAIVDPIRTQAADKRDRRAAKAAATKVEFFTLVRGED